MMEKRMAWDHNASWRYRLVRLDGGEGSISVAPVRNSFFALRIQITLRRRPKNQPVVLPLNKK